MKNDKFCCYGTFRVNFSRCTLCPFSIDCEGYTNYLAFKSTTDEEKGEEGACEGCERYSEQDKE